MMKLRTMPALRRVLKAMPSLAMGLLVLVWVLSLRGMVDQYFQWGKYGGAVSAYNGSISCFIVGSDRFAQGTRVADMAGYAPPPKVGLQSLVGKFYFDASDESWIWSRTWQVPALVLATALLPLVLGSFTSFRFRLWHYLAYTTLVAVELAYYLRWQG